jgi:hypothetical protein
MAVLGSHVLFYSHPETQVGVSNNDYSMIGIAYKKYIPTKLIVFIEVSQRCKLI